MFLLDPRTGILNPLGNSESWPVVWKQITNLILFFFVLFSLFVCLFVFCFLHSWF